MLSPSIFPHLPHLQPQTPVSSSLQGLSGPYIYLWPRIHCFSGWLLNNPPASSPTLEVVTFLPLYDVVSIRTETSYQYFASSFHSLEMVFLSLVCRCFLCTGLSKCSAEGPLHNLCSPLERLSLQPWVLPSSALGILALPTSLHCIVAWDLSSVRWATVGSSRLPLHPQASLHGLLSSV